MSLSGCDPAHPFAEFQVKLFSAGDGRGVVTVDHPDDSAERAMIELLAARLGIGRADAPVSTSPIYSGTSMSLVDVPLDRVTVRVADVLHVLSGGNTDALGARDVFVSVCTSAATGRAGGTQVSVVHLDSCALWERNRVGADESAVATLTFEHRPSPGRASVVYVGMMCIIGTTAAVCAGWSHRRRLRRVATAVTVTEIGLAFGVALISVRAAFRLRDPYLNTGQVIDRALAANCRDLALWSLGVGALVPGVLLLIGRRVSRRRSLA